MPDSYKFKTKGGPRPTISDPSVSTLKKPSMPERAAYLEKVRAGMNSRKVTSAPKPATAPSTTLVGARPSPRTPAPPTPEALAARSASRAELGARMAERAKAADAARGPAAPRDKTSTVGRSKIMDAAKATRAADFRKKMSERDTARKAEEAARTAKKAESDKAVKAAMEARRTKLGFRSAKPALDPAARAAENAARMAAASARMAERAKSASAPTSTKTIMGRFRAPVKAPATTPQNTGPENVGARPVPSARPQMSGYKKGGTVSCKTY